MLPAHYRASLIATALLLSATGCGPGWQTVPVTDPKVLQPRQQAQIWMADRMVRLHAIRIGPDSVCGIPYLQPLDCDSCRVAFSREQVDSIRVGDPPGGFWATVSLILAVGLVVGFMTGSVGYEGT